MSTKNYDWKFFNVSGLTQASLSRGSDIAALRTLDQKLWTVLSAPVNGVRFDAKTLALLDTDHDGRIRVPEVLAAIDWLNARLASLDSLYAGATDCIQLADIATTTDEGKTLLAALKHILKGLGRDDATEITLAEITDTESMFSATVLNGDGIIIAESATDDTLKTIITDIADTLGGILDRSGKNGIDQTKADAFFAAAKEYLAWHAAGVADPAIFFLKDATPAAGAAYAAVAEKIDDYFTRCRMAAFDARAAAALNRSDDAFAVLADQKLSDTVPALADFPLSTIAANRDLPLTTGINPFWAEAIETFRRQAAEPILGAEATTLSATEWTGLKAKFAPYIAWSSAKAGASVEALGVDKLTAAIAGDTAQNAINQLIQDDLALAGEYTQLIDAERVVRYTCHLAEFLENFVNQARLYNPKTLAIYQVGTLYIDARACSLCFHVDAIASHAALADKSKCCIIYCDLKRPNGTATRTVAAVVTAGFARTLWVGRNGIFYDRDGLDWDATIVKIVTNELSLREAFWAPWIKIGGMISTQVNKMLASKQTAAMDAASKGVEKASSAPESATKQSPSAGGAAMASSVAALGIAIGMMGAALSGLVGLIVGLPLWKILCGVAAVILIVSLPSVVMTWFKLRSRDLAPVLNACGWAINRPLQFSLKLSAIFTRESTLPPGSTVDYSDPYADKSKTKIIVLLVLLALAFALATWCYCPACNRCLPESFRNARFITPISCIK